MHELGLPEARLAVINLSLNTTIRKRSNLLWYPTSTDRSAICLNLLTPKRQLPVSRKFIRRVQSP
ncbi:hypothetical protein C9975_10210, partial [Thalassospira xiamenensis]